MESMKTRKGRKENGEVGKQVRGQARKMSSRRRRQEGDEGLPKEMHSSSETKMRKKA